MLFDLRGRGRRRTIKIVYITLALLMGGGLVLFGIGGGGAMQGGLVDAITGSSGGDTGSERFDKAEKDAAAATRRNPQDPAAWAILARARVQSAGIGDNFDPNSASYTESGKAKLSQAMPRPVRERIVERLDAPGPHHHPELAALMRRLSLTAG